VVGFVVEHLLALFLEHLHVQELETCVEGEIGDLEIRLF
jgi:hypothetical protein